MKKKTKTKLVLKILAKDILENGYVDSDKCPITRALARAGRPDLADCGGLYINEQFPDGYLCDGTDNKSYRRLVNKLFGMYATKKNIDFNCGVAAIPIKNFQATINFKE
jgi:hypothetical protein